MSSRLWKEKEDKVIKYSCLSLILLCLYRLSRLVYVSISLSVSLCVLASLRSLPLSLSCLSVLLAENVSRESCTPQTATIGGFGDEGEVPEILMGIFSETTKSDLKSNEEGEDRD